MPDSKRVTIYFDLEIHRALRLKAAEVDRPISEIVNAAVRRTLSEYSGDVGSLQGRAGEPALAFESVVQELRRRGKL